MSKDKATQRSGIFIFGPEFAHKRVLSPDGFRDELERVIGEGKMPGTRSNLQGAIKRAEDAAWAVLGPMLNIKRHDRFFRLGPDEDWQPYHDGDFPDEVGEYCDFCTADKIAYEIEGPAPDPILIWAGMVLETAAFAKAALDNNDLNRAASHAYALGELVMVGRIEFAYAKHFSTGVKVRRAARERADKQRGKLRGDTPKILSAMQKRINAGHSVMDAAKVTFEKDDLGKSAAANRRLWARNKDRMK